MLKGLVFVLGALVLFVAMTGAILYSKGLLAAEKMVLLKEAFLGVEKPKAEAHPEPQDSAPLLVKDLQARIAEYDNKLKQLAENGKEIAQQREELEKIRVEVNASLERIQKETQRVELAQVTELKGLADQFAAMEPESAAKQLEGLDNRLAVAVLKSMKTKSRAEIFNVMTTQRAIELQKEILSL